MPALDILSVKDQLSNMLAVKDSEFDREIYAVLAQHQSEFTDSPLNVSTIIGIDFWDSPEITIENVKIKNDKSTRLPVMEITVERDRLFLLGKKFQAHRDITEYELTGPQIRVAVNTTLGMSTWTPVKVICSPDLETLTIVLR